MDNFTSRSTFFLMGFSDIREIQIFHAVFFLLIYLAALLGESSYHHTYHQGSLPPHANVLLPEELILSGCWPHFHPCPQIHHELSD